MTWATIAAGLWRALNALAALLPYVGAYLVGKRSEAARDAERANAIKDKQLQAAADRPDRGELIERLRRGGF